MNDASLSMAISVGSAVFVGLVLPLAGYIWRERDSSVKRLARVVSKLERAVTRLQVEVGHLLEEKGHDRRSFTTESLSPESDPPEE